MITIITGDVPGASEGGGDAARGTTFSCSRHCSTTPPPSAMREVRSTYAASP